jgi:hypothetical protein
VVYELEARLLELQGDYVPKRGEMYVHIEVTDFEGRKAWYNPSTTSKQLGLSSFVLSHNHLKSRR